MAKRFIDAEDFYKRQAKRCNYNSPIIGTCTMDNITLREALKKQPTADVAEVVRCSECKHLEIINKAPIYAKCKKHGIVFELWQEDTREHFCSFGARMDGDEDD